MEADPSSGSVTVKREFHELCRVSFSFCCVIVLPCPSKHLCNRVHGFEIP